MIIHIEKENQDLPLFLCYQDYDGKFHQLALTVDQFTDQLIYYVKIQELPGDCASIVLLDTRYRVPNLSIAINEPMQKAGFLSRNLYVVVPNNHCVSPNDNYILSVRVK